MQGYKDKLTTLTSLEQKAINKFYRAALYAAQYTAFQTNGEAFQLLEGTVRKDSKGRWIFKPNKHMQAFLENANYPELLKMEESRFADLIKISLEEIKQYE